MGNVVSISKDDMNTLLRDGLIDRIGFIKTNGKIIFKDGHNYKCRVLFDFIEDGVRHTGQNIAYIVPEDSDIGLFFKDYSHFVVMDSELSSELESALKLDFVINPGFGIDSVFKVYVLFDEEQCSNIYVTVKTIEVR